MLLHGAVVLALLLTTMIHLQQPRAVMQALPIDAVVVDSQILRDAQRAKTERAAAEAAQIRAAAEARAAADAKRVAEAQAEQDKIAADARAAAQSKAAADAKAVADAQARAEAQTAAKKAASDQAAQVAAAIAQKKAADAKSVVDAKASADAAQRVVQDKKQADLKQAEDAKRAAQEQRDKAQREADLKAQLASEERANTVASGPMKQQYLATLGARIQRAWIKPPSARAGLDCLVSITQLPSGEVTAAKVTKCNGDGPAKESIENAVYRASPLPLPPDPALFERSLVIHFHPDE